MSDFFARVGDAVRSLLQECKVMVSSVESRCGEGEMVENAKKAAASALAVGKLVSDHVGAIDESRRDATDLQQTFLLDYVGKLRESVVGLIRYSRHLHSNPVDFYTKQQLDNTLKAVVQHTKHVVEASRALQETENAEEAEATQPATTASAEETKTAEAEQTMGNQLSEQSETVLSSLTSLSEAIPEQNADSFNATTKNVVAALNGLTVALQKAGKSEAALKALLEANLSVITAAKMYFRKPTNEACAKKFEESKTEVINSMKQLLFDVSKDNSRIGRTLSRSLSQKRVSGMLRTGGRLSGRLSSNSSGNNLNSTSPRIAVSDAPATTPTQPAAASVETLAPAVTTTAAPVTAPTSREKLQKMKSDASIAQPASPSPKLSVPEKGRVRSSSSNEEGEAAAKASSSGERKKDRKDKDKDKTKSPHVTKKENSKKSLKESTVSASREQSPDTEDKRKQMKRIASTDLQAALLKREEKAKTPTKSELKVTKTGELSVEDSKALKRVSSRELLREINDRKEKAAIERERANDLSESSVYESDDDTDITESSVDIEDSDSSPHKILDLSERQGSSLNALTTGSASSPRSASGGPLLVHRTSQNSGSHGTDKMAIAHRILSTICDKFPNFAKEWEVADTSIKGAIDAKIVAELAVYQIAILQEVPGKGLGMPSSSGRSFGTTRGPSGSGVGAGAGPGTTPTSGELSPGTKKKERPTSSKHPKDRGEKSKTALPAFMRIFGGGDKDSKSRGNSPRKDDIEDREKIQLEELERIAQMKDASEMSGMTMRLKGFSLRLRSKDKKKDDRGDVDLDNAPKIKVNAVQPERVPDLARTFMIYLQTYSGFLRKRTLKPKTFEGAHAAELYDSSNKILSSLANVVLFVKDLANEQIASMAVSDVIAKTEEEVSNEKVGHIPEVDSQLINEGRYLRFVRKSLQESINSWTTSMFYTASQISTDLYSLTRAKEVDVDCESTMLHLCALIQTFLITLEQSLNDIETLHYFADNSDDSESSQDDVLNEAELALTESAHGSGNSNIWEEPAAEASVIAAVASPPTLRNSNAATEAPAPSSVAPAFKPATLNQLVLRLINMEDATLQFTFFDMYLTFVTPLKLLMKFMEAYNVPKSIKMDPSKVSKHQSRVLDLIFQWVKTSRKYDFDTVVNMKLRGFLEECAKNASVFDAVQSIFEEIKKQDAATEEVVIVEHPKEITTFESDLHPFTYLLAFDSGVIAKQLTKIEYDMYKNIDPFELKGQAWNKGKRQCVSRNVLRLIQRANRISYWIATSVLLQHKLKDRARVIVKIIDIAQQLKECNNFNTLMGFVAGLNMSCVSRLKQTFNLVSKRSLEQYKALQTLLDPKSSFKSLRDAIRNGGTTILPYIGTTLSDLTFMEDGNPDFTDADSKLINMEKRRLVSTSISQFRNYQSSGYSKYAVRDPPYTFLVELPSLPEPVLYALSLEREPRESARQTK